MLPICRRVEDQERGADDLHCSDGPPGVIDMRVRSRLMDAYGEAAVQAGRPRNDDFNGLRQEGVGRYQLTVRGRTRCSAAASYLKPALRRRTLRVVTEAQAERVLPDRRRAVGVRVRRGGQTLTLRARREAIVPAGAIGSGSGWPTCCKGSVSMPDTLIPPPGARSAGRIVTDGQGSFDVTCPVREGVLAVLPICGLDEVDMAARAAERAVDGPWPRMHFRERKTRLLDFAARLEAEGEPLAQIETRDTGRPIREARALDVAQSVAHLRWFAELADKLHGEVGRARPIASPPSPASRSAPGPRSRLGTSR